MAGEAYRLTDREIIDFFRCGEKRQLQLAGKMAQLCRLVKSNRDLILANTYNPYGDGVRLRDVEKVLAKTKKDTKERLREFEEEYGRLRGETDRLDRIRQAVFRLEPGDYELLHCLYAEGMPWYMVANKLYISRSSIANRRKKSFQQIRESFEESAREGREGRPAGRQEAGGKAAGTAGRL